MDTRKSLSRSRTAEDHDKDQPFAAHLNDRTNLSVNPQARHPRNRNRSGSPVRTCADPFDRSGCGFIFHVHLVDAAIKDQGDQAVNWCLKGMCRYALVNEWGDWKERCRKWICIAQPRYAHKHARPAGTKQNIRHTKRNEKFGLLIKYLISFELKSNSFRSSFPSYHPQIESIRVSPKYHMRCFRYLAVIRE